jgi:DNA-binding SARP family transcriptional activator
VSLSIHLLGSPRIERDGSTVDSPRGRKSWGLLAYLVRTPVFSSRERLAALLFPEADDPLGSLRWTLSVLRRQLGEHAALEGDPLRLTLSPSTFLDVQVLSKGSWAQAVALPGLGHELLDGINFRSSPGFEIWLENERRHVAGMTAAILHQATHSLLARGDATAAARYASVLVRHDPFDENSHVLLVRCLRAMGDIEGATRQVQATEELFSRELGISPSPALAAAALAPSIQAGWRVSPRAVVLAQIEAGEAATAAGAMEAGLNSFRGAVAAARQAQDDKRLLARSLVALGGALVHAARGFDVEGAAALHEGTTLAEGADLTDLAATGWREIGWVQFLRAQYVRAEDSLDHASEFARGDDDELVWIDVIRGACRSDVGNYEAGRRLLRSAVARSRRVEFGLHAAQAHTLLGRLHLLRGELEAARQVLDHVLEQVEERGLTGFRPWPESFRAEIDLRVGDLDTAEERFEHAFALGCQVGDPCWESVALRGLGLTAAARGDIPAALELLVDAPKLCRRLPDTYLWIEAYALDALCSVAVESRTEGCGHWIDELESIAARRGLRELLLRSTLYRARLGEPGALAAARSLAAEIDNPALRELVVWDELSAIAG